MDFTILYLEASFMLYNTGPTMQGNGEASERVLYRMKAPSLTLFGICISDLMYTEYLPGFYMKAHTHGTWQIMYVMRGQGIIWLNDAKVDFTDGHVIVIRPHEPHGYTTTDDDITSSFEVKCHIDGELSHLFVPPRWSSIFHDNYGLRSLAAQSIEELRFKADNWDLMLRAYLLEMLIRIGRALATEVRRLGGDTSPTQTYAYRYSVVEKVRHFYAEHIQENISAHDAAEQLLLSHKYLSSLVKAETGQTASELLTDMRMSRACELLETTELNMKEIGDAVGYSDIHYFSRIFKQKTGLPPTTYRASRREDR